MIRGNIVRTIISYIMLILSQILIFKDMVLFDMAFCFAYLLIFLLTPKEVNPLIQLLLGFTTGLILDSFYNTQGMHASVSVFIMFIRPFWININTPSGGFDIGSKLNIREHGLQWFLIYAYPLIFIHHLLLFGIEAANINFLWNVLGKTFFSSFFTLLIVVLMQYLFLKKER